MKKVKVRLRPMVSKLNLPTVIKTAILPGDTKESIFIATQVGEIFYIRKREIRTFLDIRFQVIELGTSNGGYDERGLLGLAFHSRFHHNGLFYIHYSAAGTQGPGAPHASFEPDPCDPVTLRLRWMNRETAYDHIDTVEEWVFQANGRLERLRTLLNIRRPFANHNGVNSLNFSPETGKLIFTNGDGGSGYDPFNLSQDDMEIAGKIIEIDVNKNTYIPHCPVVTRFNELPPEIQETLSVIAKGGRNMPGIAFQWSQDRYLKIVGNVGQDLEEPIYSFGKYKSIPVPHLVQAGSKYVKPDPEELINFGWRAWEGSFPTPVIRECTNQAEGLEKTMAYYDEAVTLSATRLRPLTSYFHYDTREDKFAGNALTGVQVYMGMEISGLTGTIVFTDFFKTGSQPEDQGALAYTFRRTDGRQNDFSEIQVDHHFGSQPAYYVSLGTNLNQTRLYLGVHGSMNVTDFHQGSVFEIIP